MRTAARNRSSIWGRASASKAAIGCAPIDCVAAGLCSVSETIVIPVIECVLLLGVTESQAKRCKICRSGPNRQVSGRVEEIHELLRGGRLGLVFSALYCLS